MTYEELRDAVLSFGCTNGGALFEQCFYCCGDDVLDGKRTKDFNHEPDCFFIQLQAEVKHGFNPPSENN